MLPPPAPTPLQGPIQVEELPLVVHGFAGRTYLWRLLPAGVPIPGTSKQCSGWMVYAIPWSKVEGRVRANEGAHLRPIYSDGDLACSLFSRATLNERQQVAVVEYLHANPLRR